MKNSLFPFLFCFLVVGCVDKEYDKDIDMNVTLAENGVTLPIGTTDELTLSKLIHTGDNIKVDGDSIYYIAESTSSSN
ncbi:MAG: hypothetical protein LUI04_00995 [Porphyromonadaceae bacterium]|nr:hypothetical protein [Porphyromonadaceae bacterium]